MPSIIDTSGKNKNSSNIAPGSSTSTSTSTSGTYFQDPSQINALSALLSHLANFSSNNYESYLQNPVASPLFQNQLGPLLQALIPSEDRARTQLTDQFRAAGGLRSGAYGNSSQMLEGQILGERQKAAGNLLGQSFGPMMQAILAPLSQIAPLINALKMQNSSSTSTQQSQQFDPSLSGGGGRVGGGIGATPYYDSLMNPGIINPSPGGGFSSVNAGNSGAGYGGSGGYISPDLSGWDWGSTPDYYNEPDYSSTGGDLGSYY